MKLTQTSMRIRLEPPRQPEAIRLIEELDEYQRPLYPPASHHGIDIEALAQPNVLFAVARRAAGDAIGCGAIVLGPDYGEIKRMYVRPAFRGQGFAKALLAFLERAASARGCVLFMLETGVSQPQALALYAQAGYLRRAPFGGYTHDPLSVFMYKAAG